MPNGKATGNTEQMPGWVPLAARHYLAHTERGLSIRELARRQSCHPSTILRQVRRFEMQRDDPLIDDALNALSRGADAHSKYPLKETEHMKVERWNRSTQPCEGLTQERINTQAKRILLRLSEPGAVLAVAREMETAVVVREADDGEQLRTAIVDREIAQAIALKGWITCPDASQRIARYFITNAGRTALRKLAAQGENAALGFSDAQTAMTADDAWDMAELGDGLLTGASSRMMIESPLVGLSRRRDKDGERFLSRDLVATGERFREDFELAKMGQPIAKSAEAFLKLKPAKNGPPGAAAGHLRVQAAMNDLGPGLADVAFHCCCLLEGLEVTEKSMGWSARSGKIVLRIALQRLRRHYEDQGKYAPMIG